MPGGGATQVACAGAGAVAGGFAGAGVRPAVGGGTSELRITARVSIKPSGRLVCVPKRLIVFSSFRNLGLGPYF
jgi:uncharacterized protein YcfJ